MAALRQGFGNLGQLQARGLQGWTPDSSYCNDWAGVTCNASGYVTALCAPRGVSVAAPFWPVQAENAGLSHRPCTSKGAIASAQSDDTLTLLTMLTHALRWLQRSVRACRELGGWGISGRLLPELVGLTTLQRLCAPPVHLGILGFFWV